MSLKVEYNMKEFHNLPFFEISYIAIV